MCAMSASLTTADGATTAAQTFSEVTRGGQAVIELSDARGQSLVAVSPRLQGRVLTTSAEGQAGRSLGWVNEEQIGSGKLQGHFNAYGGEDRIWIAPKGGQFSVFFAPHSSFDIADWYTPAPVDTQPFDLVRKSRSSVALKKEFALQNYSGTKFKVRIDRKIRLLDKDRIWRHLGIAPVGHVKTVDFESLNRLTNVGDSAWSKQSGLLSIWILGQFQASPATTIVIPIHAGSEAQLGTPVTSDYFGAIPATRLAVTPSAIYMRGDAEYRGKLGVNPARATGVLGSYDAHLHILTVVQQNTPDPRAEYVNNAWKIQDQAVQRRLRECIQ